MDFDDDDFDDDHYGTSRRNLNQKARVDNPTMAELGTSLPLHLPVGGGTDSDSSGNAEETQQFANAHMDGLTVPHKDAEYDYLDRKDSDGEGGDDDGSSEEDVPRYTAREANLLAVQAAKVSPPVYRRICVNR